eukprot:Clim_evm2s187 gene=Clim_evmTU2s187
MQVRRTKPSSVVLISQCLWLGIAVGQTPCDFTDRSCLTLCPEDLQQRDDPIGTESFFARQSYSMGGGATFLESVILDNPPVDPNLVQTISLTFRNDLINGRSTVAIDLVGTDHTRSLAAEEELDVLCRLVGEQINVDGREACELCGSGEYAPRRYVDAQCKGYIEVSLAPKDLLTCASSVTVNAQTKRVSLGFIAALEHATDVVMGVGSEDVVGPFEGQSVRRVQHEFVEFSLELDANDITNNGFENAAGIEEKIVFVSDELEDRPDLVPMDIGVHSVEIYPPGRNNDRVTLTFQTSVPYPFRLLPGSGVVMAYPFSAPEEEEELEDVTDSDPTATDGIDNTVSTGNNEDNRNDLLVEPEENKALNVTTRVSRIQEDTAVTSVDGSNCGEQPRSLCVELVELELDRAQFCSLVGQELGNGGNNSDNITYSTESVEEVELRLSNLLAKCRPEASEIGRCVLDDTDAAVAPVPSFNILINAAAFCNTNVLLLGKSSAVEKVEVTPTLSVSSGQYSAQDSFLFVTDTGEDTSSREVLPPGDGSLGSSYEGQPLAYLPTYVLQPVLSTDSPLAVQDMTIEEVYACRRELTQGENPLSEPDICTSYFDLSTLPKPEIVLSSLYYDEDADAFLNNGTTVPTCGDFVVGLQHPNADCLFLEVPLLESSWKNPEVLGPSVPGELRSLSVYFLVDVYLTQTRVANFTDGTEVGDGYRARRENMDDDVLGGITVPREAKWMGASQTLRVLTADQYVDAANGDDKASEIAIIASVCTAVGLILIVGAIVAYVKHRRTKGEGKDDNDAEGGATLETAKAAEGKPKMAQTPTVIAAPVPAYKPPGADEEKMASGKGKEPDLSSTSSTASPIRMTDTGNTSLASLTDLENLKL